LFYIIDSGFKIILCSQASSTEWSDWCNIFGSSLFGW
jgi:hypothetical protein